MRRISFIGLTLFAAVALAACGSGSSPAPQSEAPAGSEPAASDAPLTAVCEPSTEAGAVTVTIQDFTFGTDPVQAAVGDVITWTNEDTAPHTATLADDSCTTGNIAQGASGGLVFNTAGSYPYKCSIHASMTGTIEIS